MADCHGYIDGRDFMGFIICNGYSLCWGSDLHMCCHSNHGKHKQLFFRYAIFKY